MARSKPEKIPAGDEYLPDVPEAELESMIAAIPSCKNMPKELLILTAALKRKRYRSISGIAREIGRPYATVYGWLLRMHIYGLGGRIDRPSPNRKKILDEDACRLILEWVSESPQDYKFESGIWQASMIISMIRDKMGINIHPKTLRRTLRRAGISFRKPKAHPAQLCVRAGADQVQEGLSENNTSTDHRRVCHLLPGQDDPPAGICIRLEMDDAWDRPDRQDEVSPKR